MFDFFQGLCYLSVLTTFRTQEGDRIAHHFGSLKKITLGVKAHPGDTRR